jgi:tetraacyldisaccharide 4'-kinase
MKKLRYLFFPFTVIYGAIVTLRNFLYTKNVLKSSEFDVKTISVGNLSTGGTGKTPHIEYLIRLFKNDYKIATLSRGYGRKTGGFEQANETSTHKEVGDEPLQFYHKFKEEANVYVENKRVTGVIEILAKAPETEVILLDDAFQHRAIKPGFSILLSDYSSLFYKDLILPAGNLRERRIEANRADLIVVTKCPNDVSEAKMEEVTTKIKAIVNKPVYFSQIKYGEIKSFNTKLNALKLDELKSLETLLITGIANPKPIQNLLKDNQINFKHLKFPDHHNFTKKNISNIIDIFGRISENKIILTTEKDAVRLKSITELSHLPIYYLEIEIEIIKNKKEFDNKILTYVKQN